MLLLRTELVQVFGFNKSGREHEHGRMARGVGVKVLGRPWGRSATRHFSVGVFGPVARRGRGVLTWEASTWLTRATPRGGADQRVSVKAFVRLKVGLGGRL